MADTLKLTLVHQKSTKTKEVYGQEEEDAAISAVYITSSHLPDPPPETLVVQIKAGS